MWKAALPDLPPGFSEKYERLIQRSTEACEREGVDCVDLNGAPEVTESPDELFADAGHLTAAGTRVIARIVARRLAE